MVEFLLKLQTLERKELIELLCAYADYIEEANEPDKYETGWRPVCLAEFYDNEFQLLKEGD